MASRLELHEMLCDILGSRNVYYQPPESLKLKYPCIIYGLEDIPVRHADNGVYKKTTRYSVTLVDEDPEPETVDTLMAVDYCSFQRSYMSDYLNHFVFDLYY